MFLKTIVFKNLVTYVACFRLCHFFASCDYYFVFDENYVGLHVDEMLRILMFQHVVFALLREKSFDLAGNFFLEKNGGGNLFSTSTSTWFLIHSAGFLRGQTPAHHGSHAPPGPQGTPAGLASNSAASQTWYLHEICKILIPIVECCKDSKCCSFSAKMMKPFWKWWWSVMIYG